METVSFCDADARLRALLVTNGYNTTSYLTLEAGKQRFYTADGRGAVVFVAEGGVAVAQGEPICLPEDLDRVLTEFISWCRSSSLRPLFFEISETAAPALARQGFHCLKTGEEPFIELDRFSLAGGTMANVRSSANTARRRGVTIRRHDPLAAGGEVVNRAIERISTEWLARKGAGELSFTLGTLSLEDPGDRLYFVAELEGEVIAFLTFAPIYARNGMYLDLMRRAEHCPPGTMDLLLITAFQTMAELGVALVTMGMAPLTGLDRSPLPQNRQLVKFMEYARTQGSRWYNFDALHRFKEKFGPHRWENKYLAYRHLGWAEANALSRAIERADLRTLLLDGLKQFLRTRMEQGVASWVKSSSIAALMVSFFGGN